MLDNTNSTNTPEQKDISFEELLERRFEDLCDLLTKPEHKNIYNKVKLIIFIRYRDSLDKDNIRLSRLTEIAHLYKQLNETEKCLLNEKYEIIVKEIIDKIDKFNKFALDLTNTNDKKEIK